MKNPALYRALPVDKRVALLVYAMQTRKPSRAAYAGRLVARGGGYRVATLLTWPVERLAREVVRRNAETAADELELLQLLYLEVDLALQVSFLDAAGVAHTDGVIPDELEPPYADAPAVAHAAEMLMATRGDEALHYLRTIAFYNGEGWPGLDAIIANYYRPAAEESGDL